MTWKKTLTWKDKFPMFGLWGFFGYIPLTIHAKDIKDLEKKKQEICTEYETKYPERKVQVRIDY